MTENNKIQSKNIQWFTSPYRHRVSFSDALMEQASVLVHRGTILIEEQCNIFVSALGIEHDDALVLLKILMATKQITVDLDKPIAEIGIVDVLEVNNLRLEGSHAG